MACSGYGRIPIRIDLRQLYLLIVHAARLKGYPFDEVILDLASILHPMALASFPYAPLYLVLRCVLGLLTWLE